MKKLLTVFIGLAFVCNNSVLSQTIERVVFSGAASSNNSFQPIVGTPYGNYLRSAQGSLTVSAEYGEATYEQSQLTAEELDFVQTVKVYPNPTLSRVYVELAEHNGGEYLYSLYNIKGQPIQNHKSTSTMHSIDMRDLPAGVYNLLIWAEGIPLLQYSIVKSN